VLLAMEVVDDIGAKISVRSFELNHERMMGSASAWGQGRLRNMRVRRELCLV